MLKFFFTSLFLFGMARAEKYALVIGHNMGGKETTPLRYGESDATRFAELLLELADFKENNIHLLLSPTSNQIKETILNIKMEIRQKGILNRSMFVLYYSGHADSYGLQLESETYSFSLLKDNLKEIPTKVRIGIFDACQSGVLTRSKGGQAGRPFYLENQDPVEGTILIASSSASEQAQESESLKSSIFSHHWFNALRGSADFSEDGAVTLSEAYQYAYRKTVETTALLGGKIQHPTYEFKIQGRGEVVLTEMHRANQGVYLTEPMAGAHLLLSEDYSDVFADFQKKEGRNMFIPLKAGNYVLIQSDGTQAKFFRFHLKENEKKNIFNDYLKASPSDLTRFKGIRPELEKKIEQLGKPLSQWSVDGGLGVGSLVTFPPSIREANIPFKLGLSYYVNENLDVNGWAEYQYPQQTLRGVWGLSTSTSYIYMDMGMGLGFHLQPQDGEGKIFPSAAIGTGLKLSLSPYYNLKLGFSSNLDFEKDLKMGFGIRLSLVYLGKYRNVYTIRN